MHQQLANATFRIQCATSGGSGFSFRSRQIIITNYHVIAPHFVSAQAIYAFAEDGTQLALRVLAHSPEDQFDFAIMEALTDVGTSRHILQPDAAAVIGRGTKTIFAGFPHGVPDLLVHEAIVSGPANPNGFYVDGSVNGGNSGGPIIDGTTGLAIGIVTQRRFMGGHPTRATSHPSCTTCAALSIHGWIWSGHYYGGGLWKVCANDGRWVLCH